MISFPYIERMLDLTSKREQLLTSNIANLDTPGYRSLDVQFSDALSSQVEMASTNAAHLAGPLDTGSMRMLEAEGKLKPNGNNVDLESQMTDLTKNGLQYVTLIQYLNSKLKTLKTAIAESGRG